MRKDTETNTDFGGREGRCGWRSGEGASPFALFQALAGIARDRLRETPWETLLFVAEACLQSSALVDGHGGDDRLDVANVGQLELKFHDVGAPVAQLVVHALLEPRRMQSRNKAEREKKRHASRHVFHTQRQLQRGEGGRDR